MSKALLVAWRETSERRAVLVAALFAGMLAFVSPLLPGVVSGRAAEARDAMAISVAVGFGMLVALMVGASVVARDLADGRLSFDFAQPLSGWAIAAGRFLAAIVLCLASFALALVPATLVGGGALSPVFRQLAATIAGAIALGVVVVVPLAHVASIALRSRSRWLALDLLGIVIAFGLGTLAAQRVGVTGAATTLAALHLTFAAAGASALWAAAATQVIAGRSDLRRGHRVQSLVLASALVAVGLASYGFSVWLVAVGPADLVAARGEGAPEGDWVLLKGQARGRPFDFRPAFLVDLQTEEQVELGPGFQVVFSGDGRRAAWLRVEGLPELGLQIVVADLDVAPPRVRETRLVFDESWPRQIALSRSGARIVVREEDRVSAFETDTGQLLATARLSPSPASAFAFRTDDAVRLYEQQSETLKISELDLIARRLAPIAEVRASGALAWTRNHDRLLLHASDGQVLIDGLTGEILARRGPLAEHWARTRLLADGRVAILESDGDGASRLAIVSRDGRGERVIELSAPLRKLGGEAEPGRLLAQGGSAWARGELSLIDLETGNVRPLGVKGWLGMKIAGWRVAYHETPEPGSLAARLVNDVSRVSTMGVALYDPATRTVRPILEDARRRTEGDR